MPKYGYHQLANRLVKFPMSFKDFGSVTFHCELTEGLHKPLYTDIVNLIKLFKHSYVRSLTLILSARPDMMYCFEHRPPGLNDSYYSRSV